MQRLSQDQLISQADYDQAATKQSVAEAQCQVALNNLDLAKANPDTEDIVTTHKEAATQIKQAESSLSLLELQLNDTKITAPTAGVVETKLVELGELVSPTSSLFTLLDYNKPWVKIYLPLLEVERVSLNQKAYVILDSFPQKTFYGFVSYISQEAEFTRKTI